MGVMGEGGLYQMLRPAPSPAPAQTQSDIPLHGYHQVGVDEHDDDDDDSEGVLKIDRGQYRRRSPVVRTTSQTTCIMLLAGFMAALGVVALAQAAYLERRDSPSATSSATADENVPQYFQTTPEIYAGPTATGRAPFLAQTQPRFAASSYVPNAPLETALPIVGNTQNKSIFALMGQVSPYAPDPDVTDSGFGVDEFALPAGSNISQVHVLHRHGSRYPTTGAGVQKFGTALTAILKNGSARFSGDLAFVNDWSYGLGAEILVPIGRQELFQSGVLHYYDYAHLYNTSTKIIARTTTQDRMLKSAEYFMAGFFGLSWTNNVSLVVSIEGDSQIWNNSLAGYDNCNNSNTGVASGGTNASIIWENKYLANATARLNAMSSGFTWNISDTYNAQTLCPYETVAYGYSAWCDLFTYQEWQGFEYSIDLQFAGNDYFQSPVGRAVGIGWVEEFLNRIQGHLITAPTAQDNITLDSMNTTFPLNQSLYFDFSHDTNMAAILTAFGFTQFAPLLPTTGPPANQQLIVSHLQPFGARVDIEIITAPQPVAANRTTSATSSSAVYADLQGPMTKYIHFIINQRTLPLGASFAQCGTRTDGWCELGTFLDLQRESLAKAKYEFSCNGKYPPVAYGSVTDGVPVATPAARS